MKYCTKCGNKIKEDCRFCSKCGAPTKIELEKREKERKEIKETKKNNALLYLGSGLIILASIIFAFTNWTDMSNIYKIIFLSVEMVIFLSISIFSRKFGSNMPYKITWFIGILFVPIILNLIAKYEMIGNYLSYQGSGIFVYLSISSLICSSVAYFSYKFINFKGLLYIGHLFSYIMIIYILLIFKLDNVNDLDIIIPILCILNLIIVFITSKFKNNISNSLSTFISIVLFIMTIALWGYSAYYNSYNFNMLVSITTCLLHIITILIFMKFNTKNGLKFVYPYILYLLMYICTSSILYQYKNVYIFISSLASIALYFIFSLYNNKTIKITSFILMLFSIFASIIFEPVSDKTILVISILLILVSLFNLKISDEEFEGQICKILLPITTLMSIASLSRIFIDIEYSVIYIIASILCYSIYTILFYKFNNKKLSFIFECFSYIYLGLSSILIIFTNVRSLIFIINEIVWIYYFISRMFINKEIAKNIFLLIISILNLFICSIKFNMPLYYSILFISVIFTLLDILSIKLKIKSESVYFYIAIISIIISIMFDFIQYSILSICINTLVYCMIYYILVRKKVPFIIKYIYTIFGFCLISKLFNYFIDQNVIANIITLVVFVIIIISMFLLRVDTDNKVLSYTPVIIFPYSYIINNIEIFSLYKTEAIVILLISLILIFMEKVFTFKYEKDRTLLEIILISILHIFTIYTNIIFNILLSIFYIFFGTYKKKDSFIILGIALLILSVFINLFKVIDNLSITYILLGIGIVLVTYVFIVEAKKNNKK